MNSQNLSDGKFFDLEKYFFDFKGAYAITETIQLDLEKAGVLVEKISENLSINPESRKIDDENGYVVIDRNESTNEYFLTVTFLSELTDEKPVSNCSKLIITRKSSDDDRSFLSHEGFVPFTEMFACFFNVWSVEKINIFPYEPEKIFFDYDFETFDFLLVKYIAPVKISDMQKYYFKNDYVLLSGEYGEKGEVFWGKNDPDLFARKFLNGESKRKIKLSELSEELKIDKDFLISAIVSRTGASTKIETGEKIYFGSEAVIVLSGEEITVYSPSYFLNDDD
ncbi:hypothetical protein JXL83_09350 [candidate division WOR-3 bacterium]|nr:hypothetical protein [candidate division WOR-3 bacterium]